MKTAILTLLAALPLAACAGGGSKGPTGAVGGNDLQHRHEFIDRWPELPVALPAELPNDIRIKRALAGVHPTRSAPYEKA